MPRLLPLLAFLGCALQACAAPDSSPAASPSPPSPAFSAVQKFDRAVSAYNAGNYDEAHKDFTALVEDGHLSAALAHNLANIEYKRGHDGVAALWYRRALAMKPFSPETLQNLRFLRRKTGFQTFDPHGISLSHFPPQEVKNTTILAGWLVIILSAWLAWSPPRPGRRWPLVTLLFLALPIGVLGGSVWWFLQQDPHPLVKRLVLSGKDSSAFAAPAEASSSVIALPSGSEVMPLETRGNWIYCEIPTEGDEPLRGWIRGAQLEPLWPYPADPRG